MATKRNVFYSFHYKPDNWRAAIVRSIGVIEGNKPAQDNDWEKITSGGDEAIKKWIKEQMNGRTCTVVLVGNQTANRKWINHEIIESWNSGMGIVGINIHGLKNKDGLIASPGANPFAYISYGNNGKNLSDIVKCYNPSGGDSKEKYAWIADNIANLVEEAVEIRGKN